MKSVVSFLACILACSFLSPASADVISKEENSSIRIGIEEYKHCLTELNDRYNDQPVTICFAEASKDSELFLKNYVHPFLTEHSQAFLVTLQAAVFSAKKNEWQAAETKLKKVLQEKPDLPDVILLKAVTEKQLGNYEAVLSDLSRLLALRQASKNGYKTSLATNNSDTECEELARNLQRAGKIDQLQDQLNAYNQSLYAEFSTVINTYK